MRHLTLALCLALAACDGSVIDELPHYAPEECPVPALGDSCVVGDVATGEATIAPGAWCTDPAAAVSWGTYAGDVVEVVCSPAPPAERSYRYVVGSYAPGWGVTWQTSDGTLVLCSAHDGRVTATYPLVSDGAGRLWRLLDEPDFDCLDAGSCRLVSDACGVNR